MIAALIPRPGPFRASRTSGRAGLLPALLAALLLVVPEARADDDVEEDAPVHAFTRSLGIGPLVFLGQLYGNFEQLIAPRHGLLAEGGYSFAGASSGSWSALLGYRYHFTPGLEGLFAGAFVRTGSIATEVEIEVDGDKTSYDLEGPITTLGANLGYRWQWGNGFAMSLRGGYGYPIVSDVEWDPVDDENEGIKSFIEAFFGVDLELSVGYSF